MWRLCFRLAGNAKIHFNVYPPKMAKFSAPHCVGIDFGTSNCTAFLPGANEGVLAVPLEGEVTIMPSVMFVTRREVAARQIQHHEFTKRLRIAERAEATLPPEMRSSKKEISKNVEAAMRRTMAQEAERQYWDQGFFSMLKSGDAALFGTPALKAYIRDPQSGTLIRSPKSFIGSNLEYQQIDKFVVAIGAMLGHIKEKAEASAGHAIRRAVIGRPVNYSYTGDAGSNGQAINAMRRAAKSAGFDSIDFYLEPVAAAMEFEKTLSRETRALVVDIGGGTTDCTMIRLGPEPSRKSDRNEDVLSTAGSRIGGLDFDHDFASSHFMPLLGKGGIDKRGLPLPIGFF